MAIRFLTNHGQPGQYIQRLSNQTYAQAAAAEREWLADKVIGEPRATQHCTIAELKAMGMVGVYAHVADQRQGE